MGRLSDTERLKGGLSLGVSRQLLCVQDFAGWISELTWELGSAEGRADDDMMITT